MRKTISLIIIASLFCMIALSGCQDAPVTESSDTAWVDINWSMNCARMTLDGEIIQADIPCTFQMIQKTQNEPGEINEYSNGVITPEDYPYLLNTMDYHTKYCVNPFNDAVAQNISCIDLLECGDYWTQGIGWRKGVRGINMEKGYMITYMPEINECLVGSKDPDVDPADIFAFFEEFRNFQEVKNETNAANPEPHSVNLTMTACLIGTDGTVLENFPMTVQGSIDQGETISYLRLEMTMPQDFAYRFYIPEPNGYISQRKDYFRDSDYRMSGFCYNKEDNSGAGFEGMINTEKEYLIIYWNESPGYYLVAATDANATAADITAYFTDFTEWIAPFLRDSIQIDWTMHGTWITEDGETGQKEDFSINGAISERNPSMDVLAIDISFPSTFRYSYQDQQSPFYSGSRQNFELPYYVCQCYSWDYNRADFVFSYFALSAQQEYAIFYWENYPTRFLVASKDPNADPAEILTYFEDFIVKYNLS